MLQSILNDLSSTADVEGCAVVSLDGLTMASSLMEGMDENRVGAMSAAMLALGQKTATELARGTLDQVMVKGAEGYILLVQASKDSVLIAITNAEAKLGLVLLDIRRAAQSIAELV
jgi:predicted regulator of Ras-like GTPase activity (Roadblock/LC7/MglB family)